VESLLNRPAMIQAEACDAVQSTPHGQLQAQRYDFQHPAVSRNVPPPTVQFSRRLRWWSLERRRRLAAVMRLRDQLVEDIIRAHCSKNRVSRSASL
jgi:hypothetical protein